MGESTSGSGSDKWEQQKRSVFSEGEAKKPLLSMVKLGQSETPFSAEYSQQAEGLSKCPPKASSILKAKEALNSTSQAPEGRTQEWVPVSQVLPPEQSLLPK